MYAVGGNVGYIFFGFIMSHYQKKKNIVFNILIKCLNTFAIILIVSKISIYSILFISSCFALY